ncbi:Hsp20/alpha crystallin family protein [Candidatus Parcubacteria bacterium]|nr:MAG: Hsp20/alpha crystallin family protein [Candidatus Parcubacteria bacterium]
MLPRIYDPFAEMEEMMRNLPSVRGGGQRSFAPAMDVYETKTDVMVEAPLAGIKPEDVEVSVERGVLSIQGQSSKEHEIDDKDYYRKEIRSGSFFRQVALPAPVKEGEVTAEFEDGILKITCPKSEEAKPKKIEVKVVKKKK